MFRIDHRSTDEIKFVRDRRLIQCSAEGRSSGGNGESLGNSHCGRVFVEVFSRNYEKSTYNLQSTNWGKEASTLREWESRKGLLRKGLLRKGALRKGVLRKYHCGKVTAERSLQKGARNCGKKTFLQGCCRKLTLTGRTLRKAYFECKAHNWKGLSWFLIKFSGSISENHNISWGKRVGLDFVIPTCIIRLEWSRGWTMIGIMSSTSKKNGVMVSERSWDTCHHSKIWGPWSHQWL